MPAHECEKIVQIAVRAMFVGRDPHVKARPFDPGALVAEDIQLVSVERELLQLGADEISLDPNVDQRSDRDVARNAE